MELDLAENLPFNKLNAHTFTHKTIFLKVSSSKGCLKQKIFL